MELGLSLGDTPKPLPFLQHHIQTMSSSSSPNPMNKDLGFCMGSSFLGGRRSSSHDHQQVERKGSSDPPPLQLDLLPFSPPQRHPQPPPPTLVPQLRFPWLSQNLISEPGKRTVEVMNRSTATTATVVEEREDLSSSPNNSTVSSYNKQQHQMDFTSMFRKRKKDNFMEAKSDEEEDMNGLGRKKLRLTKQQSAFLEQSFKLHNTLNPKQKLALAKQLNLRPRQVEVWFQNRRARTKLKQTEVDCEYLKRCCETLTEENRRLQKEVQELRALKSSKPFYMQLPPTTLTMCPSCERVASTTSATSASATTAITATTNTTLSLASTRSNP